MALLYILLIIIAIGVLLMSEEGKGLLSVLTILALIVGGGYVLFWIAMLAIAFFINKEISEPILEVGGFVAFGLFAIFCLTHLWKIRKQIPSKVKNRFLESWKNQRTATIVGIVAFVVLVVSIIVIILNWQ
ncbi:hypothetical protein EXS45_02120 [Candidatus Nomurabacteria bacterium]|nr:hypothetical protein [Candidatus Nomurabacteria bacterium]